MVYSILGDHMGSVLPILPESWSPSTGSVSVTAGNALTKLNGFLDDLEALKKVRNLPPAVENLLDTGTELRSLLATKDTASLSEIHGFIATLGKANGSLESLVHMASEELASGNDIDFTSGHFATAWTNSLIAKATEEMAACIKFLKSP